jgi:glycosyltransferase involved in cell wall biosynthesis
LRVTHINTSDLVGGAARAAYRLHQGLLSHTDVESKMYVERKAGNDPTVTQYQFSSDSVSQLKRLVRSLSIEAGLWRYRNTRPQGYELFSVDHSRYDADAVKQIPPSDIVNLHWISGFLDYREFFRHPRKVVWTLHDMNPFTGGCHYGMNCSQYRTGCGNCPQLGSSRTADLSRTVWKRKRHLFERLDPQQFHLVALNHWMQNIVANSPLLNRFPVTVIPNGIDPFIFKPGNGRVAREFIGIGADQKVVLFVSASVKNRRKGFGLLDQALQQLGNRKKTTLLTVGSKEPSLKAGLPHIHMGQITNDTWLSRVYNAADIVVIPSLQDNLPNIVLESMACGTPVVSFKVGGIPDMVQHQHTGLLAEPEDIEGLRNSIVALLEDNDLRDRMSINCRDLVLQEFTQEIQASRYLAMYEGMMA